MNVPSRELTPEDLELIEFARRIVDANTDGEDGVHTMGTPGSGSSCPPRRASGASRSRT